MPTNSNPDGGVPVTDDATVPLGSLFATLADDVERVSSVDKLATRYPTRGRVAVVTGGPEDEAVYIGNGDAWVDVDADSGVRTPALSTGELNNESVVSTDGFADGGKAIQSTLDESANDPQMTKVIVPPHNPDDLSGYQFADQDSGYLLKSPLTIGSRTVLDIRSTELFLDSGVDDNVIKNKDFDGGNEHIYIIGDSAGHINGNAGEQERQDGSSYLNFGIHLYNVDHFAVRDVVVGPTNKWGIVPEKARFGRISDIEFRMDGETPNQDGVHIKGGPSNKITVSDIEGTVGDDALAVNSQGEEAYGSGGDVMNVSFSNVSVENVRVGGVFRTTPEAGTTIKNIAANNLTISGDKASALKIGWVNSTRPALDEHTEITVENVTCSDTRKSIVDIQSPVGALSLRGIQGTFDDKGFVSVGKPIDDLNLSDWQVTAADSEAVAGFLIDSDSFGTVNLSDMTFNHNAPGNSDAIKIGTDATVDRLKSRRTHVDGFNFGVIVDPGVTFDHLQFEDASFENIGTTPWNVNEPNVIKNGVASESASAEAPLYSHPPGTVVDFTDTGDGSGTGYYVKKDGSGYVGPI